MFGFFYFGRKNDIVTGVIRFERQEWEVDDGHGGDQPSGQNANDDREAGDDENKMDRVTKPFLIAWMKNDSSWGPRYRSLLPSFRGGDIVGGGEVREMYSWEDKYPVL